MRFVNEREPWLGAQLQLHRIVARLRLRPNYLDLRRYVSAHSASDATSTSRIRTETATETSSTA